MKHTRHLLRIWALGVVVLTLSLGGNASAQVEGDLKDGDRYFEAGKFKKSARKYDGAIRRYPAQVTPGAYGKRAAIFFLQKKYAAGIKFIVEKALSQHPGAPEILEQKALMLWALGSKPEAMKIADAVAAKSPKTFSVQKLRGQYYWPRKPDKVVDAYTAYLKHRPSALAKGDVLPLATLGFSHLSVGNRVRDGDEDAAQEHFKKAEEAFDRLLKKFRKRANAAVNANNGLCAVYTAQARYNRAITVCEKIIVKPRQIDRMGSVWYNLARAYLANNQGKKARTAGTEFIRRRKSEPKGYILVGDAYRQERDWANALDYYLRAEQLAKGNADYAADLGIKLGISYRRLKKPKEAIVKLEAAIQIDSNNVTLVGELGGAYIANQQDAKAFSTVERVIAGKRFSALAKSDQANLLLIAGKALYNQKKPDEARARYEDAFKRNQNEIKIRLALVQTINSQAFAAFKSKDKTLASELLTEAYRFDEKAPVTNQNLALLAISEGRCDGAKKYLKQLENSRSYALIYKRLTGRIFLCQSNPDKAKALAAYQEAEKIAQDANLLRAEIYTEMAPLLFETNLDDAIEKLETAVQFASQSRNILPGAQRNLALALFRRGWIYMNENDPTKASDDFEKAARYPNVLQGVESMAFDFSHALSLLEKGANVPAAKIFSKLGRQGNAQKYLKSPYDKVGTNFFNAYAQYRSRTQAARNQAVKDFSKMLKRAKGQFAVKLKELLASSWMQTAEADYAARRLRPAGKALANVERYASKDVKKQLQNNKAVLAMGKKASKKAEAEFKALGAVPVEAMVNLGVLLDRSGNSKEAYDLWMKATASGLTSAQVQKWIAAKKRIFGY